MQSARGNESGRRPEFEPSFEPSFGPSLQDLNPPAALRSEASSPSTLPPGGSTQGPTGERVKGFDANGLEWLPNNRRSVSPLKFTGSGSEYFKIWIVNLLLVVVTLSLYRPWAKVRRLKYFYNHTELAGDALDFHGDPRKMFRGMALVGVFFLLYSWASQFSLIAGMVAVVAFVVLWPVLWWSGMRFSLAHTSWRGMRFAFAGAKSGAWRVMGVPLAIYLIPFSLGSGLAVEAGQGGEAAVDVTRVGIGGGIMLLSLLLAVLSFPAFLLSIKRYQHGGYRLGQLRTELRTTVSKAYEPFFAVIGLGIVGVLVFGAFLYLGVKTLGGAITGILAIFFYLALVLAPMAYLTARLQNLWWGRTGNRFMRFRSTLSASQYLGLVIKNTLLTVITLGFYRPFAAVAMWRARVEAVSIESRVSFESLAGQVENSVNDAAGDMGMDMAGMDVGW